MATTDQIVDTAVELGEQKSWEAVRLHDVAAALGISLEDVRAHFREKEDIVDAWFERADSAMLKAVQASDFFYLIPRQRLHRLIMAWLGALYPYRKTTKQMIYGKLEPGHIHIQVPGLMRISRTVQWMREAAGRDATYIRRALEETGLTTIYLAAFFHWMNDNSSGSTKTSRFLEGCLKLAGNLDRVVFTQRGTIGNAGGGAGNEKAPQTT
ncbi:MAG: TetR/AcrR family transcriptional regulator [Nitrosospira sp.]